MPLLPVLAACTNNDFAVCSPLCFLKRSSPLYLMVKLAIAFKMKRTTRLSIAIGISLSFFLVEIIGM